MFLDYLPYMVFTNMFAIFYLETICMTKTTAQKQKDDKKMGHYINLMITGFFLILFIMLIAFSSVFGLYDLQWTRDNQEGEGLGAQKFQLDNGISKEVLTTYIQPSTVFLKGMYSSVSIYATETGGNITPYKTAITVYDISQVLLCVILFLHQYMVMFVARESALIFIDERKFSSMSEMLRRRNLHIQYAPSNKADGSKDANEGMYEAQRTQQEENRATGVGEEKDVSSLPIYRISYMGLKEEVKHRTT